ncbi:hypothetical protein C2E23DRAFT_861175 [Lenzites betulinus]|nr:hypothetical protein C2E23DRAFT_861175 [Lenzites betulinus]
MPSTAYGCTSPSTSAPGGAPYAEYVLRRPRPGRPPRVMAHPDASHTSPRTSVPRTREAWRLMDSEGTRIRIRVGVRRGLSDPLPAHPSSRSLNPPRPSAGPSLFLALLLRGFYILSIYSSLCLGSPHILPSTKTHVFNYAAGTTPSHVAGANTAAVRVSHPTNDQHTLHARARRTSTSTSDFPSSSLLVDTTLDPEPTQTAFSDPLASSSSSSDSSFGFPHISSDTTATLSIPATSTDIIFGTSSQPTSTPAPTQAQSGAGSSKKLKPVIAVALGVVLAAVALLALAGAALMISRRRRRKRVAPSTAYLRSAAAAAAQDRDAYAENSSAHLGPGSAGGAPGVAGGPVARVTNEMQQWGGLEGRPDTPTTPVSALHALAPLRPNSFRDQTGFAGRFWRREDVMMASRYCADGGVQYLDLISPHCARILLISQTSKIVGVMRGYRQLQIVAGAPPCAVLSG